MDQGKDEKLGFKIALDDLIVDCSNSEVIYESKVIQDFKAHNPHAKFFFSDCKIPEKNKESITHFIQTGKVHLNSQNVRSFYLLNQQFRFPSLQAKLETYEKDIQINQNDETKYLILIHDLIIELAYSTEETVSKCREIAKRFGESMLARIIFSAILSKPFQTDRYIDLLQQVSPSLLLSFLKIFNKRFQLAIYDKEDKIKFKNEIFYIAYYLIENQIIDPQSFLNEFQILKFEICPLMLIHLVDLLPSEIKYKSHKFMRSFYDNVEVLASNSWELHKRLIETGINPNPVATAIAKDDVEALKKLSLNPNFNPCNIIEKSVYERYSIPNEYCNVANYALFHNSVKCLDYLLSLNQKIFNSFSIKFALSGGNISFFKSLIQNSQRLAELFDDYLEYAIMYHHQDCIELGLNYKSEKLIKHAKEMIEYCEYPSLLKLLNNANFTEDELDELLEFTRKKSKNTILEKHLQNLLQLT